MQWNDDKDVLLIREVLGKSVLILKPNSQERCQAWQRVADELNALDRFHLTGRAVRDRIMTLIEKFKVKIKAKIKLVKVEVNQVNLRCWWRKL